MQQLSQISEMGYEVGNIPPSFSVIDTQNNTISIEDYLDSGEPVIVYFFATWCPHCAQDFRYLSGVYEEYPIVDIIAVSMDFSEKNAKIADYETRYPFLKRVHFAQGEERIVVDYGVKLTTTKYAIKDGRIIYAGTGVLTEKNWRILLGELSK